MLLIRLLLYTISIHYYHNLLLLLVDTLPLLLDLSLGVTWRWLNHWAQAEFGLVELRMETRLTRLLLGQRMRTRDALVMGQSNWVPNKRSVYVYLYICIYIYIYILNYIILYYLILYFIKLYYTILYYIILYQIVLYYIILYYIIYI